jgi:hypothetical protein
MMDIEIVNNNIPEEPLLNRLIWWCLIGSCYGLVAGTIVGMMIWN